MQIKWMEKLFVKEKEKVKKIYDSGAPRAREARARGRSPIAK